MRVEAESTAKHVLHAHATVARTLGVSPSWRPRVFRLGQPTIPVHPKILVLVAVIATLSGSWTPLISNDSGTVSIGGAAIAYGAWFYLVAGIAVVSLLVAVGIYWLGNATSARAVRGNA